MKVIEDDRPSNRLRAMKGEKERHKLRERDESNWQEVELPHKSSTNLIYSCSNFSIVASSPPHLPCARSIMSIDHHDLLACLSFIHLSMFLSLLCEILGYWWRLSLQWEWRSLLKGTYVIVYIPNLSFGLWLVIHTNTKRAKRRDPV